MWRDSCGTLQEQLNSSLFVATLSMTMSESNAMRMSYSVAIIMNISSLFADWLLRSLFFMNLRVENVLSQAT